MAKRKILKPRAVTPVTVPFKTHHRSRPVRGTPEYAARRIRELRAQGVQIRYDIGCGGGKQGEEWIGIDCQDFPCVDLIWDMEEHPWPLPPGLGDVAIASHVAEHINPAKMGFVKWMNSIWEILKPGAQLMLALPYAGSPGYYQDPTHVNPCNENTWIYFDPLHPSGYWRFYRPKPWRVVICTFNVEGFMEVALEKRRVDKSYDAETKKA